MDLGADKETHPLVAVPVGGQGSPRSAAAGGGAESPVPTNKNISGSIECGDMGFSLIANISRLEGNSSIATETGGSGGTLTSHLRPQLDSENEWHHGSGTRIGDLQRGSGLSDDVVASSSTGGVGLVTKSETSSSSGTTQPTASSSSSGTTQPTASSSSSSASSSSGEVVAPPPPPPPPPPATDAAGTRYCDVPSSTVTPCVPRTPPQSWKWITQDDVKSAASTDDCKYYSIALGFTDNPLDMVTKKPHRVILTPEDSNCCRSRPGYTLTADPFLLYYNGKWTMFMEIFAQGGAMVMYAEAPGNTEEELMKPWSSARMGVLSSLTQAIIDAGGPATPHISYPHVFIHENTVYMVPQVSNFPLTIFKATSYPDQWVRFSTVSDARMAIDSQIIHWNGMWYLFTMIAREDRCLLYMASSLEGPWRAHPQSPWGSVGGDGCRGGGRIVQYGNVLVMVVQRNVYDKYGTYTQPVVIEELTPTRIVAKRSAKTYTAAATAMMMNPSVSEQWAQMATHHVDMHQVGENRWMFVYDGREPCSITTYRKEWADRYGAGQMP